MTNKCGRTTRQNDSADTCQLPAGWGTDHVGEGACKLHGGNTKGRTGPDNPAWKHGLFSEVIREEDRATLRKIEQMTTAAKLESTLNMQVMKVYRAIEGMESEERTDFIEVFEEIVSASAAPDGEIEKDQLRYLAQMLGSGERAVREWMDLIRKTAKDLHKITDGETIQHEHGVDAEDMAELEGLISAAYGGGE